MPLWIMPRLSSAAVFTFLVLLGSAELTIVEPLTCPLSALPCCSDPNEPVYFTDDGQLKATSGRCTPAAFGGDRLDDALAGKWVYIMGESATRGVALALYYHLHRRVTWAPTANFGEDW